MALSPQAVMRRDGGARNDTIAVVQTKIQGALPGVEARPNRVGVRGPKVAKPETAEAIS